MEEFINLLFKYFWVLGIFGTVVNAVIFKSRSKKYSVELPERKSGYDKLFKGMLLFGNIPWLIMGFGIIFGFTDGVFDYFNPRLMNPIVLFFHLVIVILLILSAWWIYFYRGAEFIEEHPGFFQVKVLFSRINPSAKQIKWFFPLTLIGGIGGMILMWVIDIPTHSF